MRLRCILLSALLWLALGSGAFAEQLVVGYSAVTSVFLPFWIGKEMGFYKKEGLDAQLVYIASSTTMAQAMAHIEDVKWSAVMARCYNDYLYGEYLQHEPKRLYGVALLPVQDIAAAAEELERCVKDLHMVGGVIPAAYPYERPTLAEFLLDIPHFQAREDLSDIVKRLILRDNCSDFYSLRI